MALDQDDFTLTENLRARDDARQLLRRLMLDRAEIEERLAAAGKRDPMKWVTGRSAIDNAILATRQVIEGLDRMIQERETDAPPVEVVPRLRTRSRQPEPALAVAPR